MSESNQNKKKGGLTVNRPRKTGGRGSGEFRIGSRDILATPEILSPFGFEEETATGKSRKGSKGNRAPAEAKTQAPVHNRKGKKAEAPQPPAEPPVKKSTGKAKKSKTSEVVAPPPAPTPQKPAQPPKKGKKGGPSIVSAEHSVVVSADTVGAAPQKACACVCVCYMPALEFILSGR